MIDDKDAEERMKRYAAQIEEHKVDEGEQVVVHDEAVVEPFENTAHKLPLVVLVPGPMPSAETVAHCREKSRWWVLPGWLFRPR